MITVIYPTKGRPKLFAETYLKWSSRCGLNTEFIVCLDSNDSKINEYDLSICERVIISDTKTAIEAINKGAKECKGDIIVVISDDMDCPENWDIKLLKELEGKEDYCVKVKDGIQDWLITMPIMDRKYYERFGYIYNPVYYHLYADTEMTAVAWQLERYLKVDLLFQHNHWTNGKRPKDELDDKNYASLRYYKDLFRAMLKVNFGLSTKREMPQLNKYR